MFSGCSWDQVGSAACRRHVFFFFVFFYFIHFYFCMETPNLFPFLLPPLPPLPIPSSLPHTPTIRNQVQSTKAVHSSSTFCRSAVGQLCSVSLLHLAWCSWSGTLPSKTRYRQNTYLCSGFGGTLQEKAGKLIIVNGERKFSGNSKRLTEIERSHKTALQKSQR